MYLNIKYKRCALFLFGIIVLTLGVSLTVKSNMGAGAYDAINFALSDKLGLNVSVSIALTSFIILLLSAILRREFPRIVTFITSLLMGICTDWWVYLLDNLTINSFFYRGRVRKMQNLYVKQN